MTTLAEQLERLRPHDVEGWIAAAIAALRPWMVEGEPVAYLLTHPKHPDELDTIGLMPGDKAAGLTETPLYRGASHD